MSTWMFMYRVGSATHTHIQSNCNKKKPLDSRVHGDKRSGRRFSSCLVDVSWATELNRSRNNGVTTALRGGNLKPQYHYAVFRAFRPRSGAMRCAAQCAASFYCCGETEKAYNYRCFMGRERDRRRSLCCMLYIELFAKIRETRLENETGPSLLLRGEGSFN